MYRLPSLCMVWLLALVAWNTAGAQQLVMATEIERQHLGSGEPGQTGFENATLVSNDAYHAPQYMPGYPTARPLWARMIEVPCTRSAEGRLQCKGYQWSPAIGRAEYLFFRPVLLSLSPQSAAPPEPAVVRPTPVPPEAPPPQPARTDRN